MRNWRYLVYALAVIVFMTLPFYTGVYLLNVAGYILIFMTLTLTWDMLLRSGQISFGIYGFFGVGAYTAVITFLDAGVYPLFSIFLGGISAGLIALVIGLVVLQLRQLYFAIVTLALGGIFMVVARNIPELTGGPEGRVLPSTIFDGDPTKTYWLILAVAFLTVIISNLFQKSRVHFAVTSIRDDEIVARSSGINVFKYLVFLFSVTSAIQGLAGGVYGHIYGFASPEGSFDLNFVLLPMAMALLGGIYTTLGPVIGAILLGSISEFLKLLIPYGHLLVYGIIIIVVILFFPRGIVGTLGKHFQKRK